MKKLIAFALAAVMLLGLAACGTINQNDVAILWSGDGIVRIPNSLINTMERAMYIENIAYTHYGANGDQAAQTAQALEALENGCAALAVELVNSAAAQEILDAAKAKNIPVVFFNCDVDEAVITGYDKCAIVNTDPETFNASYAELIFDSLAKEKKDVYSANEAADRNEDGTIVYLAIGDVSGVAEALNAKLTEVGLPSVVAAGAAENADVIAALTESSYTNSDKKDMGLLSYEGQSIDLILTADDTTAQEVLVALQSKGYNKDRLTTHCIPVYTVGNTADYKALVLAGRPDGGHKDDNVQEYYKSMQHIVDLRSIEEEDLDAMLYTTGDIIGDGRIAGAAVEDYDAISVEVARLLGLMLQSNAPDTQVALIPYTTIQ